MSEVKKGQFVFISLETHVKDWVSPSQYCLAWPAHLNVRANHSHHDQETEITEPRSLNLLQGQVLNDHHLIKAHNTPPDSTTMGTCTSHEQKAPGACDPQEILPLRLTRFSTWTVEMLVQAPLLSRVSTSMAHSWVHEIRVAR